MRIVFTKAAIFYIGIFFFSVTKSVESCFCVGQHPQQNFYSSDFVIAIKVQEHLNETSSNFYTETKVLVNKIYKGQNNTVGMKENDTITLYSIKYCDRHLEGDKEYIISGGFSIHKAVTSLCSLVMDWNPDTDHCITTISEASDECQIVTPYTEYEKNSKQCLWDQLNCLQYRSVCSLQDGHCLWVQHNLTDHTSTVAQDT